MKTTFYAFRWLLCVAFLFVACKREPEQIEPDYNIQMAENYANMVYASYQDTYNAAAILKQRIDEFVASPTQARFDACKTAWLEARLPYGQTEAYRFYGGPIDGEDGVEGYLNAWPIDENFIDYVQGNATSGIINNPTAFPAITKQLLIDQNEAGSETNISTGYHAIEFLLWGQDFSTNSAGARPFTDYVTGAGGTAQNQLRRRIYLQVVTDLLLDHLGEVRDAWQPDATYRKAFLANPKKAMKNIFTGLGNLSKGELAGERMKVAVATDDQENEHSCFSDNTHNDIKMNFKGIKNVYFGTYTRTNGEVIKGRSIAEVGKLRNAEKGNRAEANFTDAETKINALPAPFDQAILNQKNVILQAAQSLETLSDKIADVSLALGIEQ